MGLRGVRLKLGGFRLELQGRPGLGWGQSGGPGWRLPSLQLPMSRSGGSERPMSPFQDS